MSTHDPMKFASSLSAKLASRSRHVCAFLGAGASRACGLPDVSQLEEIVVENLGDADREKFESQLAGRGLEGALTRLRRISALLSGEETFENLTKNTATDLDAKVCKNIVAALSLKGVDLTPFRKFAAWAGRADYTLPVEVFTVNYDLLLETTFDELRVPYFDGFLGTARAGFYTELVEGERGSATDQIPAIFRRIWKLHGSVNWAWEESRNIVRLGQPVCGEDVAAIFPSDTKYEESRRVPFVVLQDHFRRALHMPESLMLISGYAFGDDHLNDIIFDAAARYPRSEFQAFCFSDIPEVLAAKATEIPNLQVVSGQDAIIGCERAEWSEPDGEAPSDLWADGKLGFGDFKNLSSYLFRSVSTETDGLSLVDLLKNALQAGDVSEGPNGNG